MNELSEINDIIEADLTWLDGALRRGVKVDVARDGTIVAAGPSERQPTRRLKDRMLLPGFVNAHSHAFQRALRGRGETYPDGGGSFWTWREAMYRLVERIDPDGFRAVCTQAFREMLRCGITTVGEFHYLHHADSSAADFALDPIVLETAREVGIRIVLLQSAYETGGFGEPLSGAQARFDTKSPDAFVAQLERLAKRIDPATQSLGIAPHSLRAVPVDALRALHTEALRCEMVFHIHHEEQRQEIEQCRAALGCSPMEWLLDHLELDASVTAVHATHAEPDRLERWIASGARVCMCPLTEASLADGIADVERMMARADAVCVGSDSNARIDLVEELRWLEYVQRLARERRGVCVSEEGDVARRLLECGTLNGGQALGINAGRIAPGFVADFVAVELDRACFANVDAEASLLPALLFGGSGADVREVCVNGRWRAVEEI